MVNFIMHGETSCIEMGPTRFVHVFERWSMGIEDSPYDEGKQRRIPSKIKHPTKIPTKFILVAFWLVASG